MLYGVEQTITFIAWDTAANAGKTGDSANFTLRWIKNGTSSAPTNAASEVDATNAPGVYKITLTSTEWETLQGTLAGKSSTSGVVIVPQQFTTVRGPNAAPGANGGLPTVNASNQIAGIAGTITTLDALDTAQDSQHATTQSAVADVPTVAEFEARTLPSADYFVPGDYTAPLDAAGVRTAVGLASANLDTQLDALPTAAEVVTALGTGSTLTAIPWNAAWDAEVQSEVADAIVVYGLDHLVQTSVTGTDIADNSIIAKMVSKSATADWDTFANTTDSLEATADRLGLIVPISNTADSFTQTSGTVSVGDYTNTATDDNSRHELAPAAVGGLDCYYEFGCGTGRAPTSVSINGYWNGSSSVEVHAYDWTAGAWYQLTNTATNMDSRSSDTNYSYALSREHMDTDGTVRIRFTAISTTTSHRLRIDRLLVNSVSEEAGSATTVTPETLWSYPDRQLTSFGIDVTVDSASITAIQTGLATSAALATVEGKIDTIDGIVDLILDDTGTSGVVVAAGSKTGYSLSSSQAFDLTGNITGNLSGSVGSVTSAVTVTGDAATWATRGLTMISLDGSVYQFTANALELAPASEGGSGGDGSFTEDDRDDLLAIKAKTDLISSGGTVTVSQGVLEGGRHLIIVRGDDYTDGSARGAIEWTPAADSDWPDLTGASGTFTCRRKSDDVVEVTKAVSFINPAGPGKKIRLELTDEETDDLTPGDEGETKTSKFDVQVTLASGYKFTPIRGGDNLRAGGVTIIEDQTR